MSISFKAETHYYFSFFGLSAHPR